MAITKETAVDQITVTEGGIVLVREAIRIIEDGKVLSETYHRNSLQPGQDVSDQPQNVQDICNLVWTPEVIAAHKANVPS